MQDSNSCCENNPMQSNNVEMKEMQKNDTENRSMLDSSFEKQKSQDKKITDTQCRHWTIRRQKKNKKKNHLWDYTREEESKTKN